MEFSKEGRKWTVNQLVTSLKCARIERVITRLEEENISEEYSTY